jgi:hypothetical protein
VKKTYYPITPDSHKDRIGPCTTIKPKLPKIGTRFETLVETIYYDANSKGFHKIFPQGSKATFLGYGEKGDYVDWYYKWPRFQFDGDPHKERIIEFDDLKPI